jgi:hypothetical protein
MKTHKHHIIPKHAGGTDDPSNIVEVSVDDHAEAHRKLYEEYGKIQDKVAWFGLSKLASHAELMYMLTDYALDKTISWEDDPEVVQIINDNLFELPLQDIPRIVVLHLNYRLIVRMTND